MVSFFIKLKIRFFFLLTKFFHFQNNYSIFKKEFEDKNLDFEKSKSILIDYLKCRSSENSTNTSNMISNHYYLIAGISLKFNFKSILEIGTYDGHCTNFISHCFPNSSITTIDLKDDDEIFLKSYDRDKIEKFNQHLKLRKENISHKNNIHFVQNRSNAFFQENKYFYDLIFVDGDHTDPVVSNDILNSIKYLNKDGLIIIDDIVKRDRKIINEYESYAAYDMIESLINKNLIKFQLFSKRSIFPYNSRSLYKYIALVQKN